MSVKMKTRVNRSTQGGRFCRNNLDLSSLIDLMKSWNIRTRNSWKQFVTNGIHLRKQKHVEKHVVTFGKVQIYVYNKQKISVRKRIYTRFS